MIKQALVSVVLLTACGVAQAADTTLIQGEPPKEVITKLDKLTSRGEAAAFCAYVAADKATEDALMELSYNYLKDAVTLVWGYEGYRKILPTYLPKDTVIGWSYGKKLDNAYNLRKVRIEKNFDIAYNRVLGDKSLMEVYKNNLWNSYNCDLLNY